MTWSRISWKATGAVNKSSVYVSGLARGCMSGVGAVLKWLDLANFWN